MCRGEDISNALVCTVRLTGERRPETKRGGQRRNVVPTRDVRRVSSHGGMPFAFSREVDPLSETVLQHRYELYEALFVYRLYEALFV